MRGLGGCVADPDFPEMSPREKVASVDGAAGEQAVLLHVGDTGMDAIGRARRTVAMETGVAGVGIHCRFVAVALILLGTVALVAAFALGFLQSPQVVSGKGSPGPESAGFVGSAAFLGLTRTGRFSRVQRGTCSDYGAQPITDADTCEKAGRELNLRLSDDSEEAHITNIIGRPEGCFLFVDNVMRTRQLWLGTSPLDKGRGATHIGLQHREPICFNKATAATETTTAAGTVEIIEVPPVTASTTITSTSTSENARNSSSTDDVMQTDFTTTAADTTLPTTVSKIAKPAAKPVKRRDLFPGRPLYSALLAGDMKDLPSTATHRTTDITEPQHAGDTTATLVGRGEASTEAENATTRDVGDTTATLVGRGEASTEAENATTRDVGATIATLSGNSTASAEADNATIRDVGANTTPSTASTISALENESVSTTSAGSVGETTASQYIPRAALDVLPAPQQDEALEDVPFEQPLEDEVEHQDEEADDDSELLDRIEAEDEAVEEGELAAMVAAADAAEHHIVPCTAAGEDCRQSRCCSWPGLTCFVKDEFWASCNSSCSPSADPAGGTWSCETLGTYRPKQCSWEGESCAETKCCKREGFTCYTKNAEWASCAEQCDGEGWECKQLGGARGELPVNSVPANNAAGTSLFCFTVVTPLAINYEQDIIDVAKDAGYGIFACEASAVYDGAIVEKGDWDSVANTKIFLDIWRHVQQDGRYREHDWTVKVDADAVFFPDRLRVHLLNLRPPQNTGVYIRNINFAFMFMGALEVLSTVAVDMYLENQANCSAHLGSSGGEDLFTRSCLDASGVGHMEDLYLLNDKYVLEAGWNVADVAPCVNGTSVAFHPYKHPSYWMGCHDVATGTQLLHKLPSCNDERLEDEPCTSAGSVKQARNSHGEQPHIFLERL